MILPTKHIPLGDSLLGVGAVLIANLDQPRTVSFLWEKVRDEHGISTFERFGLALTLLYALGIISLEGGLLYRVEMQGALLEMAP